MRTSNLTEREISGIKIITQVQTQLAQVKRAITQTIVAKKREEVRDDLREAGDRARDRPGGNAEAPNFHLHGNSDDDQADTISESESKLFRAVVRAGWSKTRSSDQSERCTKETSTCDKIEKILLKRWRPCKKHRKIHRRVEESDIVQSMRCHRSLGRRLFTGCQKPQEEITLCKGQRKKSSVQEREI